MTRFRYRGESFCHPFLSYFLENIPDEINIRIATNGTIIPQKNILNTLKKKKVLVRISDYGLPEFKSKVKELTEVLSQNQIVHSLYYFTMRDGSWVDFGGPKMLPENNKKIVADRYWTCSFGRNCLTLENSMLGYCSRSTIAPRILGYEYDKKDYLMLNNFKSVRV